MGMSVQEIATLKKLMEYEASRKEPPKGFPSLPDIPAGRYIDPRFFELERNTSGKNHGFLLPTLTKSLTLAHICYGRTPGNLF